MSRTEKLFAFLAKAYTRCGEVCRNIQEFQQRIWIVSIQTDAAGQGSLLNDTFVVSEDSFSSPMSWMHKRGYNEATIRKVDKMQRSQVVKVKLAEVEHSLLRVK